MPREPALKRYDIVSYCKGSPMAGMVGLVINDTAHRGADPKNVLILASRPGIAANGYTKGTMAGPFPDWVIEWRKP